jgi:hypothetical protein
VANPWWVIPGGSGDQVVEAASNPAPGRSQGPFATEAAAEDALKGLQSGNPLKEPVLDAPADAAKKLIPSSLLTSGQFLGDLTNANTWIRVGEVVLGLILIAVGVAELTHAIPIATKVAGIAAKGAVMA